MLTATETQRVKNFTADMDPQTAQAMFALFEVTKPGCTHFANDLFIAAHTGDALSGRAISTFLPMGLVYRNGIVPKPVREAIQKAVAEKFLTIHDPFDRSLRPDDPFDLTYQ